MNLHISNRVTHRQSLVMTGHMQQAIALLQLSNHDLQNFIEKEAEENPFISAGSLALSACAAVSSGWLGQRV